MAIYVHCTRSKSNAISNISTVTLEYLFLSLVLGTHLLWWVVLIVSCIRWQVLVVRLLWRWIITALVRVSAVAITDWGLTVALISTPVGIRMALVLRL